MNTHKLSARILPELENNLHRSGFMTAIITLDANRFKHYLKKPANLLHDHWTYVEQDDSHVLVYQLGGKHGLRQELAVDRVKKQVAFTTWDPTLGLTQSMVYDMRSKSVIENNVTSESQGEVKNLEYRFLTKKEGLLREITPEVEEAVPA